MFIPFYAYFYSKIWRAMSILYFILLSIYLTAFSIFIFLSFLKDNFTKLYKLFYRYTVLQFFTLWDSTWTWDPPPWDPPPWETPSGKLHPNIYTGTGNWTYILLIFIGLEFCLSLLLFSFCLIFLVCCKEVKHMSDISGLLQGS